MNEFCLPGLRLIGKNAGLKRESDRCDRMSSGYLRPRFVFVSRLNETLH
jgi:hypothetical protein